MSAPLTEIGLFAGIGGFSLGFHDAGIRTVALVEKDEECRHVLRRHYPDAIIRDDVQTSGRDNLPWATIVTFGFPCQDLSVAGKRAGLAGGRSGLFFEAARITYELQPDYAIWENVPGLRTSCSCRRCRRHCNACGEIAGADETECLVCGSDELRGRVLRSHRGADFFTVISTLGYIGFDGAWTLLDAQYFGVAQRRQRLFGVFARRDIGVERCTKILSLATRLRGDFAPSSEARPNIARSVTASAGHHGRSSPRGDGSDNEIVGSVAAGASVGRNRGLGNENEVDNLVVGALSPGAHPGGYNGQDAYSGALIPAVFGGNDTRGERAVSSALTSHGSGRYDFESESFVVSAGVRRLTPRECERLQGFPDDWTAWGIDESGARVDLSDSARYRQCGNAVCRNVARWLGGRLVVEHE